MVTRIRPDSRMKIPVNFLYPRITLYTPPHPQFFRLLKVVLSVCVEVGAPREVTVERTPPDPQNRFWPKMVPEVPKFFSHLSNIFSEKKVFFDFLTPPWPFFGATKILDNAIFGSWAIYYRK